MTTILDVKALCDDIAANPMTFPQDEVRRRLGELAHDRADAAGFHRDHNDLHYAQAFAHLKTIAAYALCHLALQTAPAGSALRADPNSHTEDDSSVTGPAGADEDTHSVHADLRALAP